jgi:hypothetical protein
MKPTIYLSRVADLRLTQVQHFPAAPGHTEFWAREMILTDREGHEFRIGLYSHSPMGLLLPGEPYNPLPILPGEWDSTPAPF